MKDKDPKNGQNMGPTANIIRRMFIFIWLIVEEPSQQTVLPNCLINIQTAQHQIKRLLNIGAHLNRAVSAEASSQPQEVSALTLSYHSESKVQQI